jgi:hypothetical protein
MTHAWSELEVLSPWTLFQLFHESCIGALDCS